MKREPQSLTVHLRHAAHRIHRAVWIIDSGASALHCGRVLALTRGADDGGGASRQGEQDRDAMSLRHGTATEGHILPRSEPSPAGARPKLVDHFRSAFHIYNQRSNVLPPG